MASGFSGGIDSASQSSDDTSSSALTPMSICSSNRVVDVIWAGDVYTYTIPTFTVVSVKLRHMEVSAREGPILMLS